MNEKIPISTVELGAEEERLVLEVLRSGQLAQGPMVERLEAAFAQLCSVRHAIAVSSGTTALVATMQALGIGPGDEVVTSPFTFVATLNAILEAGATARFADIEPSTFTIDPAALEAEVGERTRVVMPVHLYGQPATMTPIVALARERRLTIVEDAAQAHGAVYAGQPVGSFGTGCFSLYATKNVAAGEGGIVTTDDDAIADRVRLLRNQGMRDRYRYEIPGHNYRLTDLQAAIVIPQMARLAQTTLARVQNAQGLTERLQNLDGIEVPAIAPGRTHVFHQYTIRVTAAAPITRDVLAERLAAEGVTTGVYYPRVVFDYECYHHLPGVVAATVPEAHRAAREVLSLPVHPRLTERDLDRIGEAVRASLVA